MTEQVHLTSDGLTKIVGTGEPLKATLKDYYDNPLSGKDIVFTINGVTYTRSTNENGVASLNINLPVGTYSTTVVFEGDSSYSSATVNVTVTVNPKYVTIMSVNDYTKNFGEDGALRAKLMKTDTSPLPNRSIVYTINGVSYTRVTNADGIASLNINLPVGEYRTKVEFLGDETQDAVMYNVTVKVKSHTRIKGEDVVKMEDETKVYECIVYNHYGQRIDCDVQLKVNGVTYTRHTDENGVAKLNIRLPAGEYRLTATFNGDGINNQCSTTNLIQSIPYRRELTTDYNAVTYPSNNRGFVQSKVMVKQWSPEEAKNRNGLIFWDDTGQDFHMEIPFESYEITETDPRVKTAKFVTQKYFDLTAGQTWVFISSPYHENFGGPILKVDFDKDKGTYTYQCQDGRRNYLTKIKTVGTGASMYEILEMLLVFPNCIGQIISLPISDELRNNPRNQHILSGLRPLEEYNVDISPFISNVNNFEKSAGEILSYDSLIDTIMAFGHMDNGSSTDVYFTPEGVCQIEPVDLDKWLKTGLRVRHSDLVQYKYGFDTTNIISSVGVKDAKNSMKWYGDADLMYYFGYVNELIDPVTTQITTTTEGSSGSSSGGSGANKGKTIVVGVDDNGQNDAGWRDAVVDKLRDAGYNVEALGVGPGYFSDYDWYGPANGKVGVYIMAASTVSVADAMSSFGHGFDYDIFVIRGDIEGTRAITGWDSVRWGQDDDCNSVCDAWSGHTSQEISDMCGDRGVLVPGNNPTEAANNALSAVEGNRPTPTNQASTNTTGNSNNTTTTTVIDEFASERKAEEKLVSSANTLVKFDLKLPLNDTLFKNVHTNQLLWTELPRDFKLGNLGKVFKINPVYKVNRGIQYQENRWYIEKLVIKNDANGLFGTFTLNVFPSSYSVYADRFKSYKTAFDQAYRQQEAQQNNNASSSGGSSGALRWSTGVPELDNIISSAIAGKDNDWDKAIAIHNGLRDAGIMYRYYYDFDYGNTGQRWRAKDGPGLNCGDTAALTAEAMKAGGLDAYVSLCPGHYICIINLYDEYAVSDLTANSGQYSRREFNASYGNARCRNRVDYPY